MTRSRLYAIGAAGVVMALIGLGLAVSLPYWAEMGRLELIFALTVGAAVGGVAGDPKRGPVNATLVLVPAILLQASFAIALEPLDCGSAVFTLIVGGGVFNELTRYPWAIALGVAIAVAFGFIVLRRGTFATRTAITTLLFLLIAAVSLGLFEAFRPSFWTCPVV